MEAISPMIEELKVAENSLTSLCMINKDTDFVNEVKFTNGKISIQAKGKSTLKIDDEDFTVAQLKNLKKLDCIRTKEEVNKDVVMALITSDESVAPIIGVTVVKPKDKVYYDTYAIIPTKSVKKK
jgi:phage host-nuclease inhibitor protein Gam